MVTAYIENDKRGRGERKEATSNATKMEQEAVRMGTEIKSRKDFPSRFTVNWFYGGTEWTSVNLEPLQLSSESLFESSTPRNESM